MQKYLSHTWFSIIEVLVGIFIFSLGLVAIYWILVSSLKVNDYNKNAIIASNLAREQIEIIRNIRDTNYEILAKWDRIDAGSYFTAWKYYTVQNSSLSQGEKMVDIEEISWFKVGKEFLADTSMQQYQLCLSWRREYVYCKNTTGLQKTPFYKYVYLSQAEDENKNILQNAYQVESHVIWNMRGYHEFDIKTLLTDWRRI